MKIFKRTLLTLTLITLLSTMVDRVHLPSDHLSFLVLAPYPTLFEFDHNGGESIEAWERKNPGVAHPWWLKGEYITLMEVTDG